MTDPPAAPTPLVSPAPLAYMAARGPLPVRAAWRWAVLAAAGIAWVASLPLPASDYGPVWRLYGESFEALWENIAGRGDASGLERPVIVAVVLAFLGGSLAFLAAPLLLRRRGVGKWGPVDWAATGAMAMPWAVVAWVIADEDFGSISHGFYLMLAAQTAGLVAVAWPASRGHH